MRRFNTAVSGRKHSGNMSTFRANDTGSTYQVKLRLFAVLLPPEKTNPKSRSEYEKGWGECGLQQDEILVSILISPNSSPPPKKKSDFLVLAGMWAWFVSCRCVVCRQCCSFTAWGRKVMSCSWVTPPVTFVTRWLTLLSTNTTTETMNWPKKVNGCESYGITQICFFFHFRLMGK